MRHGGAGSEAGGAGPRLVPDTHALHMRSVYVSCGYFSLDRADVCVINLDVVIVHSKDTNKLHYGKCRMFLELGS